VSAAACLHRRRQGAGERDRRPQVDPQHAVDLELRELRKQTAGRHARVGDEHVHARIDRRGGQPVHVLGHGEIRHHRPGPEVLGQARQLLLAAAADQQS
jgi:hypothetical protein